MSLANTVFHKPYILACYTSVRIQSTSVEVVSNMVHYACIYFIRQFRQFHTSLFSTQSASFIQVIQYLHRQYEKWSQLKDVTSI